MRVIYFLVAALLVSHTNGFFLDTIGDAINGAANLAGNVIGGTVNAAGNLVNGLANTAGHIVSDVANTAGALLNTGLQVGANVVGAVVDTGVNVLCAVAGELIHCKDAPGGGIAPLPIQCRAVADIVFVVDASGSIGSGNFKKQLSFATNLAASFKTGPNDVKIGLVAFSNDAQKWFDLKDTTGDNLALYQAILKTPYSAGGTATDRALNLVSNTYMFESFAGGRDYAPDIVVVLTDGQSNNPTATATAASRLRNAGVTIFSVGIGWNVNEKELLNVASRPENVFRSNDFDVLGNILYQLLHRVCVATGGSEISVVVEAPLPEKAPACTAVVDLIFVLDSSGSIGPINYKKQINFTIDLSSNFKIGPSNVLVGAVIFSHLAQKYFDLKDNPSLAQLRRVLGVTPYINATTKTDQALDLIVSAGMFNPAAGGRSNSKKIAIVITDGLSDNPTLTKAAATRLKSQGVTILAVGIGAAQDAELQNIASGSQNVFKATNFDALKQIVASVTQRACPGTSG